MEHAINKTASVVGLSPTTVQTVVETYEGLKIPVTAYKCPFCYKEYKTSQGLIKHLSTYNPKGKAAKPKGKK